MDNGGNLYIESVNIGSDYHTTTFFEYLGLTFDGDGEDYEVSNLKGSCLDCSESLKFNYKGGTSPHYSVDRLGSAGASMLFSSEDTYGRIFANEGINYKVIASSIVIGAVASGDKLNLKPYIFSEFLNYFMDINPVTGLQENISAMLNAGSFPNPFSYETAIVFETGIPGHVKVEIFNINGQIVKELAHGHYPPGSHTIFWNGTDNSGNQLKNGLYICRIRTTQTSETHKLFLSR